MRMNIHPADRHKIVNNHVSNWQSIRDRKRIWIRCPGPVSAFTRENLRSAQFWKFVGRVGVALFFAD